MLYRTDVASQMATEPLTSHEPAADSQDAQRLSVSPPGMPVASTLTLTSGISCGPESRQVTTPAAWSTAVTTGCRVSHQTHRWVGGAASPDALIAWGIGSAPVPIVVTSLSQQVLQDVSEDFKLQLVN